SAITFADVSAAKMSHATSLLAVSSQLSISTGVAISALAVEFAMQLHGHAKPAATDFPLAFVSIAAFTALAFFVCLRLPANAGSEMANRATAAKMAEPAEAQQEEPRRKSA